MQNRFHLGLFQLTFKLNFGQIILVAKKMKKSANDSCRIVQILMNCYDS